MLALGGMVCMAIFHLSVKPIGRGMGRSAVGASAYRSGEKIRNEYDGVTHDYTKRRSSVASSAYRAGDKLQDSEKTHDFTGKQNIVHSEIMLPSHAPREYADRSALWNAVEKCEKAINARTAREVVIALPVELTQEQNIELVRDYIERNFASKGMCADVNIHVGHIKKRRNEKYPFEDLTVQQENPHAHIMLTVRPINKDGSWGAKSKKEYILDKNGERIKLKSGNFKSRKVDTTDWDKTTTLEKWREDWARTVNQNFERLGIDERIDHRTLKAQGIDREPTIHMGHGAWNLEKKGVVTERGEINRGIYERNKAKEPHTKSRGYSCAFSKENATAERQVAEHLHELKEKHYTISKEISELQARATETQREISISHITAEEITERAENIQDIKSRLYDLQTKRRSMGVFTNRKDIDKQIQHQQRAESQATDYFTRTYKINPEQAEVEITRLEKIAEGKSNLHSKIQGKLKPLIEQREHNIFEYQRQKMLLEIRPDKEEIHKRLTELEKESQVYKNLVRDDVLRLRCNRQLDNVTERNFEKIMQSVSPKQQKDLSELREFERVRLYRCGRF